MKKIFYVHITNILIKNLIIALLALLGIRKGKRFILFQPGYTNKADSGIVCWSEIVGFTIVWATSTQLVFDIQIHNFIHNEKFAKEIGLANSFIQQESYSSGSYSIKEVVNILLSQPLMKKWFTNLYYPAKLKAAS